MPPDPRLIAAQSERNDGKGRSAMPALYLAAGFIIGTYAPAAIAGQGHSMFMAFVGAAMATLAAILDFNGSNQ